jgi:ubiquitin C-terminal hydrolase
MAVTNKLKIIFPNNIQIVDNSNKTVHKYELTSFIEHFGTHNFGHYIAYRKYFDKWVMINDSSTHLIDNKKAFQVPNPYILFYRKVIK